MTQTRRLAPQADDPAAPLGVPAILLALTMLFTPLVISSRISGWSADYGPLLYVVLILYLAAASRLLCWGVAVRKRRRR
ncbi:hypothetical protein OG225_18320 [Nocardia sp. NBC_01377]|uniref:hypothetical protein n=1 Tax=Nocardia sp. NBC_01377 TaxID=2903595 RepID=UPI0032507E2B